MVVGSGWGNVFSGFFREYRGEGRVFRGEDGFGFGLLGGCHKFSSGGQLGNDRRSCRNEARSTPDNSVDRAVLFGAGNIFTLRFPVIVSKEVLVSDSVYVYVSWGFDGGADEVGFMAFGVGGEREEKFLGLVKGFFDRDGLVDPVDGGVDIFQPGES